MVTTTVQLLVGGGFIYRALSIRRRNNPHLRRMEKMARLGFYVASSLIDVDLGWGFVVPFYAVQDCSRDYFEVHGL